MTAPVQELPPWLSYSTTVATDNAGNPTATVTTVINLPLTYYGAPIPLGTDSIWVYGGLSSPPPSPSVVLPTGSQLSSIFATPTSVSAPPSTTSPSPSSTLSTPPPSTVSSPPSLFPSSVLSSVSSSSAPSPIHGQSSSHAHHAGVIAGSVLGAVVGSILLLFILIFFLRKWQRGQRRRSRHPEPPTSQVMWMWHDVHGSDDDQDADFGAQLGSPDYASPQSSGDERDAFLRRTRTASDGARDASASARLVDAPRPSGDSSGPIGVALVARSKDEVPSPGRRYIISREQLDELSPDLHPSSDPKPPEEVDHDPDEPLLPPPPLNIDVSYGSRKSLLPSERSVTPGNDPESAQLYTAQRVQVGQSAQSSPGTTWSEGLGIPNILRRSWLNPQRRSATSTTSSPKSSLIGRQLTDSELEAGRSLNVQMRAETGHRDGARPISGLSALSAGSGNTIFYDAQSREDLSPTPPPIPQGTASTGRTGPVGPSPLSGEPIRASVEGEAPPAYEPRSSDAGEPDDDALDYLDVPIPRPASPFASASSKRMATPPGLGDPGPFPAAAPSPDVGGTVDFELLEEDPPTAGERWRHMALGLPSLHERRTTFGLMPTTIVYPRELAVSEQGSLHSMRSYAGAHSGRSASGSAPTSNSNSQHSRGVTANSLKSLAHSSSISSTERRLTGRNPGEVSPPLSATGRRFSSPPPPREFAEPSVVRPIAAPPPIAQSATVTSTATRSSVTTHTSLTDPVTGEVVRIAHPSWTGGRDDGLEVSSDVRLPPSSWGGSWTSPSHLRALQNRVAGRGDPSRR